MQLPATQLSPPLHPGQHAPRGQMQLVPSQTVPPVQGEVHPVCCHASTGEPVSGVMGPVSFPGITVPPSMP